MAEEGAGPKSPFWPSSANTNTARSSRPTSSWTPKLCGECHKDIYEQWKSSMHHFASFNNQFYRKSIEYMQDVGGHAGRASGAPAATITPSSSTAASTGPSRSRSTRRKRRTASAACRATPSCTSAAAWATAISRSSTRRCTSWPPATTRTSAQLDYFLTYLNPEPHRQHVHEAVHAAGSAEYLRHLPQGAPRRAGEQLPLGARLQRLRQLAGQRRLGPGRAVVLLPAEVVRPAPIATCRWSTRTIPAIATARSTRTASRRPTRRSPYVNQDAGAAAARPRSS